MSADELADLHQAIVTELAPRDGVEAATIVDALELFTGYCDRFNGGSRDARFSLLDQTPIDSQASAAAQAIRDRVLRVVDQRKALERKERASVVASLRARLRAFDVSDVEPTPLPDPPDPRKAA